MKNNALRQRELGFLLAPLVLVMRPAASFKRWLKMLSCIALFAAVLLETVAALAFGTGGIWPFAGLLALLPLGFLALSAAW